MKAVRDKVDQYRVAFFSVCIFALGIVLIAGSHSISNNFWNTLLRDVGFVFSPVGLLSFLFQVFAEKDYLERILDELRSAMEPNQKRSFCIHDWSITDFFQNRAEADLSSFFGDSAENIDILTSNLISLTDHLPILRNRAENGVSIRILALNPDSAFVEGRYRDLGLGQSDDFKREILTGIRGFQMDFDAFKKNHPDLAGNIALKVFDNLPTLVLFRSDNRLIIQFILSIGRGRENPQIEFDISFRKGKISGSSKFQNHFEAIWEKSKDISVSISPPCLVLESSQ